MGRFILFGALGFSLGGLLAAAIPNLPLVRLLDPAVDGAIVGASGGAALGLAMRDRAAIGRLAAIGAVAYIVAYMLPLSVRFANVLLGSLFGGLQGAIIGAGLGLAIWSWADRRKIALLAIAGAIGSGLSVFIFSIATIGTSLNLVINGLTIGISLGVGLGYLWKVEILTQRHKTKEQAPQEVAGEASKKKATVESNMASDEAPPVISRRRGTSFSGFIIGLIIGGLTVLLWGIGLINVGLVLFAYFKRPFLGGLMLAILGVLWWIIPTMLFQDDKMFNLAFVLIFLPIGFFTLISGILFMMASRKPKVS
jgi:MFS family permease